MPRSALHPYVALLLLLCLGRTLLPETWVVAWHPHAHTAYEPAHARPAARATRQLLFTARHQHCHTEQLYNVPYTLGSIVGLPQPRSRPYVVAVSVAGTGGRGATTVRGAYLRGPPARC